MNDRFAAFRAMQAFGLCVGQHTAFFEGFQQIEAAMFDDEEAETLFGSFLFVVEGIRFVFDEFDTVY